MADGLKRAADAARATRGHAPRHKITQAKAARLVKAIAELQGCTDCPSDLSRALDDARMAISPWYDR
jgi:hypothetical protein